MNLFLRSIEITWLTPLCLFGIFGIFGIFGLLIAYWTKVSNGFFNSGLFSGDYAFSTVFKKTKWGGVK